MNARPSSVLMIALSFFSAGAALLAHAQDIGYDSVTPSEEVGQKGTGTPHIIYRLPVYGDQNKDGSVFVTRLGSSEEILVNEVTIDSSGHLSVLRVPTINKDKAGKNKVIEIPYFFEKGAKTALKDIRERGFSIDVSRCIVETDEHTFVEPLKDSKGQIVEGKNGQPIVCSYRNYKQKIRCAPGDSTPTVPNFSISHYADLVGASDVELRVVEREHIGCPSTMRREAGGL